MKQVNQASNSTLPLPASPIIVTGATGYLGSALVSHLRNVGANVLGFSRRGGKDNSTYDCIEETMRDAAGMVHCAAITEWFGDDEEIMRVNGEWPVALYRQANECRVRKFVFISSIAVYGY